MTADICWEPSKRTKSGVCGGTVTWTRVDGEYWSRCASCRATGAAAIGERLELEKRGDP